METDGRLRRLVADEIGECCDADVQDRLDDLETLSAAVPDDFGDDVATLETLGDETRYRLARLLVAADGELCVCELAPLVDVSDSAVSHALSDLTETGLVDRRKDGRWRYYSATPTAERLIAALDESRDRAGDGPESVPPEGSA
ncbi:MAG: ArsR/SmtB family transcription factor [Haloarculaceae archaeon]